jgi:hypothetical protein
MCITFTARVVRYSKSIRVYLGMSLTRDQLAFSMGEITGKIWMAEFGSDQQPDR